MLTEEERVFLKNNNIREDAISLIEESELNMLNSDGPEKNYDKYIVFSKKVLKTENAEFMDHTFRGAGLLLEKLRSKFSEEERLLDIPEDRDLQPIDPNKWANPSIEEVKAYCDKIIDMKDMTFGYWWNLRNSLMRIIDLKMKNMTIKQSPSMTQKLKHTI